MAFRTPPRFSVRHAPRVRPGLSPEEMAESISDLLTYAHELDSFMTQFVVAAYEDVRSVAVTDDSPAGRVLVIAGETAIEALWGFVTFDGVASALSQLVTLPKTLQSVYSVQVSVIGQRTDRDPTGPTDFASLANAVASALASTSSVTVGVRAPVAPAAGTRIGFSLLVVGAV